MAHLPFRQVHLDFHTSPHIPGIGADFDAEAFVATLKQGHVNSITVFAKCHHGYSYYPTKVGTPHPHLERDLLGEMVAACKSAGIRVPAYTTVVWDELAWATHPEWRQLSPEGTVAGPSHTPLRPGWKNLCPNTGYAEYVIAQIEEATDLYPVDGWFIDIVRYINPGACVCATCLAQMQAQGVDPSDPQQLSHFALAAERNFMRKCTAAIRAKRPELSIFYNSRLRMEWNPDTGNKPELDDLTHLEIESLPGGFWGYDHFPLYARYYQTFGRELMMMTGRFHTTWGDFGGLRNRAALEFECFQGLAHGAVSSIGDQLHPRGALFPEVYKRIGEVYAAIEQREQWVADSVGLADIGVLTASGGPDGRGELMDLSDRGALHVLEQTHHQFQFVDAGGDLTAYDVVVLPDTVPVDERLAQRLRNYLAQGGRLLISGHSGLNGQQGFALAHEMGVEYVGAAPFAPDYLELHESIAEGIEPLQHVCELPGVQVRASAGAEVLAHSVQPYFNRTWEHFCSHQYTPMQQVSDDPVVVRNGNLLYVARPLFREYADASRRVHRQVLANCLSLLLPRPLVRAPGLPTTAIVTLRRKEAHLLVHLLHYVHQRRGRVLDVIEDVLPLHNVALAVRAEQRPVAVRLVPEGQELEWRWEDGYVQFTVPQLNGYQIVQIEGAA